jgi:hypothetical protein
MRLINLDKIVEDLEETRKEFANTKHHSFTINEGAVIAEVLDIVIEAIKANEVDL